MAHSSVSLQVPDQTPQEDDMVRHPSKNLCEDIESPLHDIGFFESDVLGRGHFATVYRGRCSKTGRDIAVKVLRDKNDTNVSCVTGPDKDRYRTLLKTLDHRNVVWYADFVDGASACYVVMQLCNGIDLQERFQAGALAESEALECTRQILAAVAYIHGVGLTHCDVKPENARYQGDAGPLKLLDFGLASLDLHPTELRPCAIVGSLPYCAPEVLAGRCNMRCDVWSVGVILHLLVHRRFPYDVQPSTSGSSPILHPATSGAPEVRRNGTAAGDFAAKLLTLSPTSRCAAEDALAACPDGVSKELLAAQRMFAWQQSCY